MQNVGDEPLKLSPAVSLDSSVAWRFLHNAACRRPCRATCRIKGTRGQALLWELGPSVWTQVGIWARPIGFLCGPGVWVLSGPASLLLETSSPIAGQNALYHKPTAPNCLPASRFLAFSKLCSRMATSSSHVKVQAGIVASHALSWLGQRKREAAHPTQMQLHGCMEYEWILHWLCMDY